jgi:hypothetical protein
VKAAEFDEVRKTFPWTERIVPTVKGGLVQVIDRNGQEVSIFVMTKFLEMITVKLAPQVGGDKPAED